MAVVTGSIKVSFPVSFARVWAEGRVPPVLSLKNGAVAKGSDKMVLDTKHAARESQETNDCETAQPCLSIPHHQSNDKEITS
jgi:hypothetical protein